MSPQLLSIVIPAYNEANTLEKILQKVIDLALPKNFAKEIIIVNDCSTDNTLKIAKKLAKNHSQIQVLTNATNLGKSQSVKRGILASKGDYVVIQDADLEYEPEDIVYLLKAVLENKYEVGYGNRFGKYNQVIYGKNFYGNLLLSFFSNLITIHRIKVNIPDMEVCYKLIRGDVARDIAKTISATSNFGFEPEITAKLSKYNLDGKPLKFIILPINYYPRSIQQGKKMKAFKDGSKAFLEIIKYNFFS